MSKGKRYEKNNKNEKNKIKRIIIFLIQFILILVIIYTGIEIYRWYKENAHNNEIIDEISNSIIVDEDNNDIKINFNKLKENNSDMVAWLKVSGTDIEYPVVKSSNNDYYLTHSFDKTYNGAGWIFADYKNKFDGFDKNIVVYGHNRIDGSMFGTLKNILTDEWQNNQDNLVIPFITENEKSEYQVFSVYRIEKEDYYITTNFGTDKEFNDFINEIKLRSMKDFGIDITSDDNILTLSTCANDNKYRVVLHAKKVN